MVDVLSEALSSVRMTGAIFLNVEFAAPWSLASPLAGQVARALPPGTEQIVCYHLVTEGRAWVKVTGEPELRVEAGDIVIIPHGAPHLFYNGETGRRFDGAMLLRQHLAGDASSLPRGNGGNVSKLVCGFLGCERQAERLFLSGLPSLMKLNIRQGARGAWLENSVRYLGSESFPHQPGHDILSSRMAEALFIETLRGYIGQLPPDATGWLAGARDPIAGAALALLHRRPAERWTVERLAGDIGTSRSVLSDRFSHYLGEGPLAYLGRWRMQLASRLLEKSNQTVLQIGLSVGYESEAAFVRAFKRRLGLPPARYRRSLVGGCTARLGRSSEPGGPISLTAL